MLPDTQQLSYKNLSTSASSSSNSTSPTLDKGRGDSPGVSYTDTSLNYLDLEGGTLSARE